MPEEFQWAPDIGRGEWLRPMETEPFGSILSIVPPGFEAYARVFHPVDRDRPRDTKTWYGVDATTYFEAIDDIESSLERERSTWAQSAASFRTTMHAEAQYARLVRRDYGNADGAIGADGWRYGDTFEGCFDAASLTTASTVLARHTTTPDAGIAAIWEGWGGLVSSAGIAHFGPESTGGASARNTEEVAAHIADPTLRERLFTAARQGIAGPRFDLHGGTGRHYVLFEAGANTFADAAWPRRAPWVDGVRAIRSAPVYGSFRPRGGGSQRVLAGC